MPVEGDDFHVVLDGRKVAVPRTAGKRSRVLLEAADTFEAIPLHGISEPAFERWLRERGCGDSIKDCLDAVRVRTHS